MNRRALVTVATGNYVERQKRLVDSFGVHSPGAWVFKWSDQFPVGSPQHDRCPYGFKLFGIAAARAQGCTQILWADSPILCVASLEPFWERLEKDGHFFFHGEPLGARISDECLRITEFDREEAFKLNLIGGSIYGFNFDHPRTREFFDCWMEYLHKGAFAGYAINSVHPRLRGALSGRPEGFVSNDPRVGGHNHDESVATVIAHRLGMKSEGPGESVFAIANVEGRYPHPVCIVAGA